MKQLAKKLKKLLKKKEIEDVVIFGSLVKGAVRVNDIDIAVISNGEISRDEIKKILPQPYNTKIHLQILRIKDYDKFIWITLIREGFSVKHNKHLHEVLRIEPVVLYRYELKQLTASKKVMFERAIKKFTNINKLSNRVVLVPIDLSGEFSDFLKFWEIDFESQEYGLLPLVRQE